MPRTSAASLSVISRNGVETIRRPDVPVDLDDEQGVVWKSIVNSLSADWFPPETHGLLTQYCRLIVRARRIAELLSSIERTKKKGAFKLNEYQRLIRDEAGVSKAIAILGRNMRLTQASTSRQEYVKKRPMTMKRPWEDDDDEEE